MTSAIKIFFLAALGFASLFSYPNAATAAETMTPATHMWIRTSVNSVVYVPARSLEQCILLAKQAAEINSNDGICYNANIRLQKINCQKSVKSGGEATCSVE